ncbi:phosphonate ABC transporter ATP-binding protein [Thermomonospora umbrina]|uniref:Phosphonate transport system ATP-binding protein n=1 Tax=Thermomonospora umbrina TaxID=111806 RepID=A0A3D9SVI0_9ACTN|nr:phosphonate ABC transporter ATP-binding protein [Thermomonospora umbrina]REE99936.1 phosphonate transport system ATP-binding protein [Thermomonospora umbrina]
MSGVIHCDDLTHTFDGIAAVDRATLTIAAGEFVGLVGPSGAGKTTLLRTLNGFVTPSAGRAIVAGRDVGALNGRDLRRHRRQVGMIYQRFHLVERATAFHNALSGAAGRLSPWRTWLSTAPPGERVRALDALARVGLADRWAQRVDTLSGGQRQRVAIARTVVQDPQIVLADEPVASLDPASAERVLTLLADLARKDGRTVVASLHQVELAGRFCDRIIALDQGRVVIDAPARQVTAEQWGTLYRLEHDVLAEEAV